MFAEALERSAKHDDDDKYCMWIINWHHFVRKLIKIFENLKMPMSLYPPVYLHLIFEISSVTRFFFNFEISSLKNWKINLISKLIFAGYTGSKNQVRTRQKIEFVSKSIFFQVCNKLPNWHFKNQAQIDTANVPLEHCCCIAKIASVCLYFLGLKLHICSCYVYK